MGDNCNWDSFIHPATFAYNNSTHSATEDSPAFLLYGVDPRFPNAFPEEDEEDIGNQERSPDFVEKLNVLRKTAYELGRKRNLKNRMRENNGKKVKEWKEGQKVWLLRKGKRKGTGKFSPKYVGPYTIVRLLGPVTVELSGNRREEKLVVHIDRLKAYYAPVYKDKTKRAPQRREIRETPIEKDELEEEDPYEHLRMEISNRRQRAEEGNHRSSEPEVKNDTGTGHEGSSVKKQHPYNLRGCKLDYRKLHYGV
ncbi:uncharacterized protein LOC111614837 [Centruroides sculpturatus]|uniref:uncharacterized protein LOC111614837 n=1 Tax=Centruroides sculpturatus TaxID=218467 RepID=UPI000C6DF18C|nr:uncharacterized protein LOC111614837 [Centruroides sculpturatus]